MWPLWALDEESGEAASSSLGLAYCPLLKSLMGCAGSGALRTDGAPKGTQLRLRGAHWQDVLFD